MLRSSLLPLEHLDAELASFPINNTAALAECTVTLPRTISTNGSGGRLWRAAERWLLQTYPGISIDEAVHLRDQWWFQCEKECGKLRSVPLHVYLRRMAGSLLHRVGHEAIPRLSSASAWSEPESKGDAPACARRFWRWMVYASPPDLMLAAIGTPGDIPRQVGVVTPLVDRLLSDSGFAEVHQHIGAAMDFPTFWVYLLRQLASSQFDSGTFESPGAELGDGRRIADWLVRAAIVRYLLGSFLSGGVPTVSFASYVMSHVRRKLARFDSHTFGLVLRCCHELRFGERAWPKGPTFSDWQLIYRNLTHVRRSKVADGLDSVPMMDRLHGVMRMCDSKLFAEPEFVARGLRYLESHAHKHRTLKERNHAIQFEHLFWQVVRVRNIVYRHVVQRPMTPGLQFFIRHFCRMRPGKREVLPKVLLQSSSRLTGAGKGLRSLEVRTTPSNSYREMRSDYLELFNEKYSSTVLPTDLEIGYVLHFAKRRGGSVESGLPDANGIGTHADPSNKRNGGYRFSHYFEMVKKEAIAWEQLFKFHPEMLALIRGVDVCSDELAIPSWVVRPLFQQVRTAANTARNLLSQRHHIDIPPLRTTAHAGEDFVHLLTGMRHIDEAFRTLEMGEGDRIGHGIALGVDPIEWSQRTRRSSITRETRWRDLLWLRTRCGVDGLSVDGMLQSRINDELQQLTDDIFDKSFGRKCRANPSEHRVTFEELRTLMNDLHQWDSIVKVARSRFSVRTPVPRSRRELLFFEYVCSPTVYMRAQEVIAVDTRHDGQLLAAVQDALRREVSRRGIIIEVNPSSNFLIGDLCDLQRHPLWRMLPPVPVDKSAAIPIAIGSDDPLTFATSLREEYQLVHDTLIHANVSQSHVMTWLDTVRETGLRHRFTLSRDLLSQVATLTKTGKRTKKSTFARR